MPSGICTGVVVLVLAAVVAAGSSTSSSGGLVRQQPDSELLYYVTRFQEDGQVYAHVNATARIKKALLGNFGRSPSRFFAFFECTYNDGWIQWL